MPFHFNGYSNFHDINLDWIIAELKKVHDEYDDVKQLVIDLEELKNKYEEVYNLFEQLENDFNSFTDDIESEMSSFETDIRNEFSILTDNFENEFRQLSADVNNVLAAYNTRLIDLNIKIDNAITNLSQSIKMINPFTGQDEPLSDVIYQLASFHMENAITAGEYDALNLTAQVYDNMGLTAYQYDVNGKVYLMS